MFSDCHICSQLCVSSIVLSFTFAKNQLDISMHAYFGFSLVPHCFYVCTSTNTTAIAIELLKIICTDYSHLMYFLNLL